jgi:hypothetical protein
MVLYCYQIKYGFKWLIIEPQPLISYRLIFAVSIFDIIGKQVKSLYGLAAVIEELLFDKAIALNKSLDVLIFWEDEKGALIHKSEYLLNTST